MSKFGTLIADLIEAKIDAALIGRVAELAVYGPAGAPETEPKKEVAAEPVYRPPELAGAAKTAADMWASTMVDEREAEPGAVPQDAYGLKTSEDAK